MKSGRLASTIPARSDDGRQCLDSGSADCGPPPGIERPAVVAAHRPQLAALDRRGAIGLNGPAGVWLDVEEFERWVSPGLSRPADRITDEDIEGLRRGVSGGRALGVWGGGLASRGPFCQLFGCCWSPSGGEVVAK